MDHVPFIPSSTDEHMGCFPLSATVNSAAMLLRAHVSVWTCVFTALGLPLRAELLGHTTLCFRDAAPDCFQGANADRAAWAGPGLSRVLGHNAKASYFIGGHTSYLDAGASPTANLLQSPEPRLFLK